MGRFAWKLAQRCAVRLGLVVGFAMTLGCAANSGTQCRVGADCASGMCLAEGVCVPVSEDGGVGDASIDSGSGDSTVRDSGAGDSTADDGGRDSSAGDAGGGCTPDHDGIITRAEVPLRAGLRANFLGATGVDFDTRGAMSGGERVWDLSGDFTGDRTVLVETRDPSGEWFSGDFAGASYVTELSLTEDLLGVFEIGDAALTLRGVVSPSDGLTRTNLDNSPPVTVLDFPLQEGKTWSTDTTVSGLALGVASFYTERYDSAVDQRGTLITPFGRFDVLRVRTELTRTVGLVVTHVTSYAFVSECFGTVATMTGEAGDTGAELSRLAEVRRLAP